MRKLEMGDHWHLVLIVACNCGYWTWGWWFYAFRIVDGFNIHLAVLWRSDLSIRMPWEMCCKYLLSHVLSCFDKFLFYMLLSPMVLLSYIFSLFMWWFHVQLCWIQSCFGCPNTIAIGFFLVCFLPHNIHISLWVFIPLF